MRHCPWVPRVAAGLAVGAVTGCLLCGFVGEVSADGDHALPSALAATSSTSPTTVEGSTPFKIEYVELPHTHVDADSLGQLNTITAAPSGSPTSRKFDVTASVEYPQHTITLDTST